MPKSPNPSPVTPAHRSHGKRFFKSGLPIFAGFFVHHEDFPYHDHDYEEWVLVEKGSGEHRTSRRRTSLRTGTFLFLPPGQVHGYGVKDKLHLWNVLIHPAWLKKIKRSSDLSPEPFPQSLTLPARSFPLIRALLVRIRNEVAAPSLHQKKMVETLFTQLLLSLDRQSHAVKTESDASPALDERMEAVTLWMNDHFAETIQPSEIAKRLDLDPAYLARLFRKATGYSLLAYRDELRVEEAARLLRKNNTSVETIALQVGFTNASLLHRAFVKRMGSSPSRYRADKK